MVRGDGRVTYSRRHAYHTKSNKMKVVKTPGGKLVAHFHKKSAKGARCGDCGITLPGVSVHGTFDLLPRRWNVYHENCLMLLDKRGIEILQSLLEPTPVTF